MQEQARALVQLVRQRADEIQEKVRKETQATQALMTTFPETKKIVNEGYIYGDQKLPVVVKDVQEGPYGGLFYENPKGGRVYLKEKTGQKQRCREGSIPGAITGCGG